MPAGVDILALIGFVLESLFYGSSSTLHLDFNNYQLSLAGFYCPLFAISIFTLFSFRDVRRINGIVIVLHCSLFIACTLHYALEFDHFHSYLVRPRMPFCENSTL